MTSVLAISPHTGGHMGAAEADIAAGIELLRGIGVSCSWLRLDLGRGKAELFRSTTPIDVEPDLTYDLTEKRRFDTHWLRALLVSGDGAALQLASGPMHEAASEAWAESGADTLWLDNSFMWPLARVAKDIRRVIVRSQNFEPSHVLSETEHKWQGAVRIPFKMLSEWQASRSLLLPISPRDAARYRRLGMRIGPTLPLRQLPSVLEAPRVDRPGAGRERPVVGVLASTQGVAHNRRVVRFVTDEVAEEFRQQGADVELRIFGKWRPDGDAPAAVSFMGFVPDLRSELARCDAVLSPYLGGAGQQMKVFEPLALEVPLVTTQAALAGYPFKAGEHFWQGGDARRTVRALMQLLQARDLAREVAVEARSRSLDLFSRERLARIVESVVCPVAGVGGGA